MTTDETKSIEKRVYARERYNNHGIPVEWDVLDVEVIENGEE